MEEEQQSQPTNTTTLPSSNIAVSNFSSTFKAFRENFAKTLKDLIKNIREKLRNPKTDSASFVRSRNTTALNSKQVYILILAVLAILLISTAFFLGRSSTNTTNAVSTYKDSRPLGPAVKATQALNKEFVFPLLDDKGVKVSEVKYKLTTAELEDTIIVNGQRANAVRGRTFLVINLEITNQHTQGIQINSKDYLRLTVNGKNESIAPDIHNDPVEVQAISTKITRLGFPINDSDKKLNLQIGEIKGQKQFLDLNF